MDYIKILSDLISIDTTVPPGRNYRQAIEYLAPLFEAVGFENQIVNIPPEYADEREGRISLISHRRKQGKPRLIFYAHADVVPAEGWDAFKPVVKDGKIFGRGAADMKGGVAALLLGLEVVKDKPLQYDTSVMITVDEEFSQDSQLRYLSKFLQPLQGANVFSLDSNLFIGIANLGLVQMDIKVKGKSVHSGLSHLGVNAVENSVPLMQSLLALKRKVVARKSRVKASPDTGLAYMEGRLNINKIDGGLKTNIVPDECLISIDRRLIPEETVADAEKELLDTLKSVPDVDWEVQKVFRIPTISPCEDPIVDKLADVLRKVTGSDGKYGEMGSGDLSSIVVNEWGGRTFGLGVIRTESNIHGKNEFAYIRDIENVGKVIATFLQE